MKVYLAGPILDCSDEECNDWRDRVIAILGEENCLNPMRRDYRTETVGAIGGVAMRDIPEIIVLDKIDIRNSTALLVSYSKHSDGTAMEVFYANQLGIPVVLFTSRDNTHPEYDAENNITGSWADWNWNHWSPWMIHHATKVVDTLDEALDVIQFYHDEGV